MRAVQELVGHQDLTMTQRYSHLSPGALGDTIRLLRGLYQSQEFLQQRRGIVLLPDHVEWQPDIHINN